MRGGYDWTPYLWDDERLLWQGQPDGRLLILTPFDIFFIWSMIALVSAIPEAVSAWREDGDWRLSFVVFGNIPLFLFVRFVREYRIRRKLRYAVTNFRALSSVVGSPEKLQSVAMDPMLSIGRTGWFYPMVVFSRRRSLWLAKFGTVFRLDGPALSYMLGKRTFGTDIAFFVVEEPDQLVFLARDAALRNVN